MGKILKRIRWTENAFIALFVAIAVSAIELLTTGHHSGRAWFAAYWLYGMLYCAIFDMVSNRNADN